MSGTYFSLGRNLYCEQSFLETSSAYPVLKQIKHQNLDFFIFNWDKFDCKQQCTFIVIRKNLLLPFRARSSLFEAGDLYDIEIQSSQSVGDFSVEVLKTSSEFRVTITMRSHEWRIVANPVDAFVWRQSHGTVIVFSTTKVLCGVMAKVVVVFRTISWAAPFRSRIHYTTFWCERLQLRM